MSIGVYCGGCCFCVVVVDELFWKSIVGLEEEMSGLMGV